MKFSRWVLLTGICLLALTSRVDACLWDWDTLQMERRQFPGVLEMITGKFVQHSPEYYEWRRADRTQRMRSPAEDPQLADDLAVALSKLGKHAEAIAVLEQALKARPDRYETLSNLGTIHMLAGDLKTGKGYIDRAIVINPDAHFGRERYQSLLAEYFLTARKRPHPVAESASTVHVKVPFGFARFVIEKRATQRHLTSEEEEKEELSKAQQGVLGMMHFANYDSPLLLEALGDLLVAQPTHAEDALQLAARAYYRISQVTDDEGMRNEFRAAARNCLVGHHDYIEFRGDDKPDSQRRDELEKLAADLHGELSDAQAYVAKIADDEKRWIAAGVDVDEVFATKYYDSLDSTIDAAREQLAREPRDVRGNPMTEKIIRSMLITATIFVAIIASIVAIIRYSLRRRSQ